ncbi:MAG: hypothetical protein CMB32_00025 [Euryarchaeota archaeon]|nr:hypothetical protein [Euryarchaeota archaeon]
MAAPKKIRIVYQGDKPPYKGPVLDGTGVSGSNTWPTWVRTRQTTSRTGYGTAKSPNRYMDKELNIRKEGFNLHCQICLEKGCEGSLLNAQPSSGTSWKIGMQGWFSHADIDPSSHAKDCPCYRKSPYKYKVNSVRRTVVLTPDLSIQAGNPMLKFSVDITKMYKHEKEEEISDVNRKSNYNMIYSSLENEVKGTISLDGSDPNGITISGTILQMPESEFTLIGSKGRLWGDPNIGKVIMRFFDLEKLDLLIWRKHGDGARATLQPTIVTHQRKNIIQMTLSQEHYVWNNHPDISIIKSLLQGMPTVPKTGTFNNPISQFTKINSESVEKIVSKIYGKYDLEVLFETSRISADVLRVDYSKDLSHVLVLTNNTKDNYLATAELQDFGTKYVGIDHYEDYSKYDLSVDEKNVERFAVEPGKTRMFPLLLTGSGRIEISAIQNEKNVEISQRILLSKSVYDEEYRKLSIKQLDKTKLNWGTLIPALLKSSKINGFDDYDEVPSNHGEIDEILLADIMRHKYTSMENQNELVHSGTITGTMNRLQGLAENLELEEQSTKPQKSHQLLSYLFESQYNKIEDEEKEEARRVWDIDENRNFKLVGYEEGHFSPKYDTEWSLLISRKSLSQLKISYPNLSSNDIKFLSTGHRLINREKASMAGLKPLDRLPSLDIYPERPAEFLLAHFDDSTKYDDKQNNQYEKNHWLNLSDLDGNLNLSLYSDSMGEEPTKSKLWTETKQTELKIELANGGCWYMSIQRLANPPQSAEDEDRWTHIYLLHLEKEEEDEKHRVILFNSSGPSPPSIIKEYYDSRGPDDKKMLLWQHLRDAFRAFIAASGQMGIIRNPVDSLAPYNYRKTIIQPFHERNSNLFNEITSIDSRLAISLSNYAKIRLWLQ